MEGYDEGGGEWLLVGFEGVGAFCVNRDREELHYKRGVDGGDVG